MARIITIVSDGTQPIKQQSMTSGYNVEIPFFIPQIIADLNTFIALQEACITKHYKIRPIEQNGTQEMTREEEIARLKSNMNAILDRLNKLKDI